MVLGMSIETFTIVHVVISLMAIASGIVVLIGMLGSHRIPAWTAFFLLTTVLTSVTGFLFPIRGFTPAIGTGICVLSGAGGRALCPLRQTSRGCLALDLCRLCRHRALSQCAGADNTVVPEITGPQAAGSNPVRTAVPGRATRRANCFPDRRNYCRAEISPEPASFPLADRL